MKKHYIAALAVTVAIATTFTVVSIASANTTELHYERMHEPEMQKVLADLEVILNALAQEIWIQRLIKCESGGNPRALNADDGGSRSVGILQFKDKTFMHFSKVYELSNIPQDIWRAENQIELVRKMLNDGLENHWANCTRKLGPYPRGM